jgi:6,7-dimethyl-8-ribityllumazine synthase
MERFDEGGMVTEVDERARENVMQEIAEEQPPAAEQPEQHAPGEFRVRDGYGLVEGSPDGNGKSVALAVSRFNGEVTTRMLESALAELEKLGVESAAVTIVPVPGAFELPLAAMALARTRRYACVVALGCVIRGETPHFDYVAGEAASGLQLATLETGVPVAFGVLTTENRAQAEARIERARDAVRGALEMADVLQRLRGAPVSA